MPRLLLVTCGSLGDVLPYLALAHALRLPSPGGVAAGGSGVRWSVTVVAHPEFETRIREEQQLDFAPLRRSIQRELRDTPEGEAMRNAGVFTAFSASKAFFSPLLHSWAKDVAEAHAEWKPDLVLLATFPAMCCLGSIGDTPYMITHTVPATPTSAFAPPTANAGFSYTFQFMNSFVWSMGESAMASLMPVVDPKHPRPGIEAREKKIPVIYAYSAALCPKPADWPAYTHVVGALNFESAYLQARQAAAAADSSTVPIHGGAPKFAPSKPLAALLAAASTPAATPLVYIGFGSMLDVVFTAAEATALLQHCVDALVDVRTGPAGGVNLRAIIHIAGLPKGASAPTVPEAHRAAFVVTAEYIPHAHLFPHCDLIVHHGGAGTTHSSLLYSLRDGASPPTAAAVLALPCSATADQPFWGDIVHRAGAGPAPLLAKGAARSALATRFRHGVAGETAAAMRLKAGALAQRMRSEDGVAASVALIDATYLATAKQP